MQGYADNEDMSDNADTSAAPAPAQKKAPVAMKGTPKHVHDPKSHADGHNSGHKKIKRFMKKPYFNENAE